MTQVSVRQATASDAEACAATYAPFVRDTVVSFEEVPPDAGEMAARIARAVVWLVAESASGVVGFAYAAPHHERAAYRFAVDLTVYLAPQVQGRGVGRQLYEQLMAACRDQGLRRAYAGITLPNPRSVRLHEAVGFRPVGVYERVGWKQGAWHDVGWWQLDLADPLAPPDEL